MNQTPGFYPDPTDNSQQRFWNGREWTDQFRMAPPGQSLGPPNSPTPRPNRPTPQGRINHIMKAVLLLALAATAVAVTALGAPVSYAGDDYNAAIASALADHELNNTNAEGAPQQEVVNGWTAKDLLTVTTQELNVIAQNSSVRDNRIAILLLLGVLGIVITGLDFDALLGRRTER